MSRTATKKILNYCIDDVQSAIQQNHLTRKEASITITVHNGEHPKLTVRSNGLGDEIDSSFHGLVGEDGGYKTIRKSRNTDETVETFWTPDDTIQSDSAELTGYGTQFEFYIDEQHKQTFLTDVLKNTRNSPVYTQIEIYDENNQLEASIDVNGAMNRRAKRLRELFPTIKYTLYLFLFVSLLTVFINSLALNIVFLSLAILISAQSFFTLMLSQVLERAAS